MNNKNKTNINWYPGHMAKTKRQIKEDLKLLDARIPISSRNPDIEEITKGKKKIIVLNKSDLAEEKENQRWLTYYSSKGIPAVLTDSQNGKGIGQVINKIEEVMKDKKEEMDSKGRTGRKIRVMILGIPNVGKSSFINRIAKKNVAQTGNKPGVTRQKQWIKVSSRIELLDTPGVLWPKLDQREVATNLAYTGTIKDDVLQTVEIGFELLRTLITNYTPNLMERYKLTEEQVNEIMQNQELEPNEKVLEVMNLIGRKRGAIISGGEIDIEKVANIIIDDFRSGRLGRITLETVKGE